jgi:tRNA(Ile)-lysidine synthase
VAQPLNSATVLSPWQEQLEAAPQILVGFSGGLDSSVLLALLTDIIPVQRLCAVHINHGLSNNASDWQSHAEAFCLSLGVQLHSETVAVQETGQGLEAAAREARYQVFENLLQQDGVLLLGHHADDQVETVLYHLLRGSGSKGLSGIPASRAIARGQLIRPLLSWQKAQLQTYADQSKLRWIEDETNLESTFDRNYLRNNVVPEIAARWPDYAQRIAHSAQLSKETEDLAMAVAVEDLQELDARAERGGWSLCLDAFAALSSVRQKNTLRQWSGLHQLPLPGHKIIDEILCAVIQAREDAAPKIMWQGLRWGRFRNRLYLLAISDQSPVMNQELLWQTELPLHLPDGSSLSGEITLGKGLRLEAGQSVTVRTRLGGERCMPAGRKHSNSLKKLLQESNLEPWWRDRIPLLYRGEQLVSVGDLWVCEGYQAAPDQPGISISWHLNSLVDSR